MEEKETQVEDRLGGGWLRALENPWQGDRFDTSAAGGAKMHSVLGQVFEI